MRIDWTEYDLSEAAVTRGVLWWKRRAIVQLVTVPGNPYRSAHEVWRYANSGTDCEPWLVLEVTRARNRETAKRRYEDDWQPVRAQRALPAARRVSG